MADITYIATDQGWLYLATVMDLFSRRIVGWSMQPRMKTDLVADALKNLFIPAPPPRSSTWSNYAASSPCIYLTLISS